MLDPVRQGLTPLGWSGRTPAGVPPISRSSGHGHPVLGRPWCDGGLCKDGRCSTNRLKAQHWRDPQSGDEMSERDKPKRAPEELEPCSAGHGNKMSAVGVSRARNERREEFLGRPHGYPG
jgi:hypothetical protein